MDNLVQRAFEYWIWWQELGHLCCKRSSRFNATYRGEWVGLRRLAEECRFSFRHKRIKYFKKVKFEVKKKYQNFDVLSIEKATIVRNLVIDDHKKVIFHGKHTLCSCLLMLPKCLLKFNKNIKDQIFFHFRHRFDSLADTRIHTVKQGNSF